MSRRFPVRALFALAASATLLLTAGLTLAAAGSANYVPASVPPVQRQVVWVGTPSQAPHKIVINSESVGAPSPDEFQITYAEGSFTLEYKRHANASVTSEFKLTFSNLVEWNDTNGNGILDDDSILETIPLGPTGFGNLPIRHFERVTPDGGDIHSFLIQSNNQEVTLNLTIAERIVRVSPQEFLTPMEAKLTIDIQHRFTVLGAKLGLEIGIQTANTVKLEDTSWDDENHFRQDDRSINVTNDSGPEPSTTFFAWANTANVSGQERAVTVTGPEASDSVPDYYQMYLAYPAPSEVPPSIISVVHDPTLGVVSAAYESLLRLPVGNPNLQGDVYLYAVSMVLVAGLVAATIVLASRRRGS